MIITIDINFVAKTHFSSIELLGTMYQHCLLCSQHFNACPLVSNITTKHTLDDATQKCSY